MQIIARMRPTERQRLAAVCCALLLGALVMGEHTGSPLRAAQAQGEVKWHGSIMSMQFPMRHTAGGGWDVAGTEAEIVRLACVLRASGYADYRLRFTALIDLVDADGTRDGLGDAGLTVVIEPQTALDCEKR